jgi:NAD(P)-dependent dehydrogenase (short-subunit alcohol dehydrogenase family)
MKKYALVTGGTGGIGLAAAVKLGGAGYDIIVTGIDVEAAKAAVQELKANDIACEFIQCDSTNEEDVSKCFAYVNEKYGKIDVLVNNVGGLGGRQRVEGMETEFFKKVMALNFDSAFYASRAAIPLLKKGENASIINYSTIAVFSGGGIGAAIYAASKGAVEVFTRALAKELAEYNIRVNAVSPGTIDTAFHSATSKEVMESWKAGIPMKRFGQPKEVAAVIEFLASDKASYLTGEVIQINGGQAFL